jgi:hypothetical protein
MRTGVKKCKRSILFSPWSAAVRTNLIQFANSELVPASCKKIARIDLGLLAAGFYPERYAR